MPSGPKHPTPPQPPPLHPAARSVSVPVLKDLASLGFGGFFCFCFCFFFSLSNVEISLTLLYANPSHFCCHMDSVHLALQINPGQSSLLQPEFCQKVNVKKAAARVRGRFCATHEAPPPVAYDFIYCCEPMPMSEADVLLTMHEEKKKTGCSLC